MIKLKRSSCPKWWKAKQKEWGGKYKEKLESSSGNTFTWYRYQKVDTRQFLLECLRKDTSSHCSYCDGYEMGPELAETIDHFKPKTTFPEKAYHWNNLFLCCVNCQKRNSRYSRLLLKPDTSSYAFHKYFVFNYKTGELNTNPMASKHEQKRAKLSIELFGLNKFGRPNARKRVFKQYTYDTSPVIDEYPYRFMFL